MDGVGIEGIGHRVRENEQCAKRYGIPFLLSAHTQLLRHIADVLPMPKDVRVVWPSLPLPIQRSANDPCWPNLVSEKRYANSACSSLHYA